MNTKIKFSYGIGAVGKDMVYILVSSFLMYYFNTVLGVSATFIGVLFIIARIFDALNDPFMGVVVAKTHTRYGKFRPWLLLGTILNAVVLVLLFSVPQGLSKFQVLVYISIGYILWGITYTIMDIPYWSMIPAITKTGKDRETMSVIARSCAGLGAAIPTALTLKVAPILGQGNERIGFSYLAVIIALFFVVSISITVYNVKEVTEVKKKAVTVKEMITSLFQNDQAMVVVVAIIVFNASLYLTQQLAIYFFKYDIGNGELYGIFGLVGGATQILAMMCLPLLRKKFGRKTILAGAIGTTILGYSLLFLLGSLHINNIVLMCGAAIIIFIGFGLATVLTTIFLADTVDYGEYKNGQRNESVIFSLQTFVVKLASAVAGFIAGIGIDLIHLNTEDNAVQTAQTLLGLRAIMLIVPMIGLLISITYFVRKYKLSEGYLEEITKKLSETKKKEEAENCA